MDENKDQNKEQNNEPISEPRSNSHRNIDQYYYGRHAVMELVKSGKNLNKLYLSKGIRENTVADFKRSLEGTGVPIKFIDRNIMDKMFPDKNHQGIAAEVSAKEYSQWEEILERAEERGEDPLILILDSIEDPHNLGAVIRTAEAAGVHGIIIPKNRSVMLSETVAKTAAGALENVLISRVTNLSQIIDKLKERNVWVYGTDLSGQSIYKGKITGATAIVLGNESKGVSPNILKKCDVIITIPMIGQVNSLNVSVATGVILFELLRQRTSDGRDGK